jgi:uncharacterized protein YhhL (DUF1145 family)
LSHLSPTGKLLTLQSVCITCRLLFSLSVISPSRAFLVDVMDFLSIIYQRKIELGLYKCCTSLFIYIFGIFSLLKSSINYEMFEKKFCCTHELVQTNSSFGFVGLNKLIIRKIHGIYNTCFIYIFGIFSLLKSSINYEMFEKKFCWYNIKTIKNYIVKKYFMSKIQEK